MSRPSNALVLFSGGQDSTTCLAWALTRFARVETIGFDYGQRHSVEMTCRRRIRDKIVGVLPQTKDRLGEDHVLDLSVLGEMSETALTRDREIELGRSGLPSTFVPGRNIVFFTFAAALAYRRQIFDLVGGMCETDYSGYPDCRDETIKSVAETLSLGMDERFHIHTPLMWLSKSESWSLAYELGGEALIELIVEETHTCYLGERGTRHVWGYGCGLCPACDLRAKGYNVYTSTL